MVDRLIGARMWLFAAAVAGLVVLLALDRRVAYEQSLTAFFPEGDPDVAAYRRSSATFGTDNIVFVTYDDPELLTPAGMDRLTELAAAIGHDRIDAVLEVQSLDRMPLFWDFDDGLARLVRLPKFARDLAARTLRESMATLSRPDSPFTVSGAIRSARGPALDRLRSEITTHPLLLGTLVDAPGTTTSLVVRLARMAEQDPKRTVADLRATADAFARRHGLAPPALVGPPVLLADGFTAIENDGRRLATVGLLLIAAVMLSVTRSLWWAVVPVLAGWLVWRLAELLMNLLGLRLSLSGGPLVAQIIVLTIPAASHLAIHFRDALARGVPRPEAARETLANVGRPIFWTATTGALGYAALLTSRVVPVFQFGAVLAACTLAAALLTALLSPAAMRPPIPLERPVRAGRASRVSGPLNGAIRWVADNPAMVVVLVLLAVLPLLPSIPRLEYESNYINAFQPRSRVVADYRTTEARLGGIGVVSLVLPAGEALDLATLQAHRRLGDAIAALRRDGRPAVASVLSLASVLDPQGKLAALGDLGDEALRLKLDLIAAAPQGNLMASFWSPRREGEPDSGWARLVLRIEEATPAHAKETTFRQVLALADREHAPSRPGVSPYLTGLSYLLTRTTRGVIDSSWTAFVWSAVGILLMLALAYRSVALALLAILPTLLSVGLVLGVTALAGVKLDLATALVASVALGLSVDDTFHCLMQYRRLRRGGAPPRAALLDSYQVTGPGVLLSSLAVAVGFAVLRLSEFVPFANFGTMVGVATLGSSLGNLVLLPACLALGHRWAGRGRTSRGPEAGTTAAAPETGKAIP